MEIVDYLLARKKAGGSDVTIEQLSVTENGTYSEQGIAYSPVVVDVPAPENSYQLKDVPSGTISTIEDGTDLPMSSLKVGVEPVQDLHGYDHPWVGGAGKNLCPINSGSITVGDFVVFDTPLPSGTYSFSFKASRTPSSKSYAVIVPYDIDGNAYNNSIAIPAVKLDGVDTIKSENKSFGNGISKLYIYSIAKNWSESRDYTLTISDLQLEEGSTATAYEPYSNICPISGWTAANVTRCGKNICPDTYNIGMYDVNGVYINSVNYRSTDKFAVIPNTQYTSSLFNSANTRINNLVAVEFDKNKNPLKIQNVTSSFTTSPNTYYISLRNFDANISDVQSENFHYQLELGSTATTYEPYSDTTYTIQFRDGDNPLTVYGGTLDVTSGELVVDRAFLTNDYLVNTADYESAGRNCYVLIGITLKTLGASIIDDKLIASALKTGTQDDLYSNYKTGIAHWWNTRIAFSTGDSTIASKSAFKEWLANNGSDVCYELAEPTTYHLTPTQIRTLVGNNNIWADTGNIIEGKYFKEL